MSDKLEGNAILGRLVRHLLEQDLTPMVQSEGEWVFVYVFKDGRRKDAVGWIKLNFDNDGAGVFTDYSADFEELLKPVIKYAEALAEADL